MDIVYFSPPTVVDEGELARSAPHQKSHMSDVATLPGNSRFILVGLCGGSSSGKTTICHKVRKELQGLVSVSQMEIICMDSFYKQLTEEQREMAFKQEYNFDHPDAIDFEMIKDGLKNLKKGRKMIVPTYDFVHHARKEEFTEIDPWDLKVVLFEGIFTFFEKELRDMLDIKIFIDCDDDVRLIRRIRRDMETRGRSLDSILTQYEKFVKNAYDSYISHTKRYADVIVPFGFDNRVAVDIIADHVKKHLPKFDKNKGRARKVEFSYTNE